MIRQMYRDKVQLKRDGGWYNWVGQGRTVLDRIRSNHFVCREEVRSHDRTLVRFVKSSCTGREGWILVGLVF